VVFGPQKPENHPLSAYFISDFGLHRDFATSRNLKENLKVFQEFSSFKSVFKNFDSPNRIIVPSKNCTTRNLFSSRKKGWQKSIRKAQKR